MSRETSQWLNTMTLIGSTDSRGTAWHYRATDQGDESNHYPGFIPVDDVERRLFAWNAVDRRVAVEVPASMETMTHISGDGIPLRWEVQSDRKAIVADDDHSVLGLFKDGYQSHQYRDWLLNNVSAIVGGDLGISSAGLLRGRAVAWVEVSVSDAVTTPEGVTFRPNLLGCTSFNGSLATTYKRTVTNTVCDNTMSIALGECGPTVKVKHSRNSLDRVADVREALYMVTETSHQFAAGVARLVATPVSNVQFREVLNILVPIDDADSSRARTIGQDKRAKLASLYTHDQRVAPWAGTAYGVVQAFNTWSHHEQGGLPADGSAAEQSRARADRNAWRAITGATEKSDADVLRVLADVVK